MLIAFVGTIDFVGHLVWHEKLFFLFEHAFFIIVAAVMSRYDYYAIRNRMQPDLRITPDRDEATTSRKPIDNRSQEI
jgi:hypothetical protein